ncbi:hypothetical protein HPB50_004742 [Hyalomma asiaticum]|uniref:Uncharacterized protein n=1 Tax=Hyalomma asiaticum TaxID=266040 RepID=A0ACB7T2Y7_HYAAI|nr:hypothetical protein HPB50_004742 [Hyalomma asiaticum]
MKKQSAAPALEKAASRVATQSKGAVIAEDTSRAVQKTTSRPEHSDTTGGATRPHEFRRRKGKKTAVVWCLVGAVFVATVAAVIAVYFVVSKGESKGMYCRKAGCMRYSDALAESLNPEEHPCNNFYLYVCGKRDPRVSVRRTVFYKFKKTFVSSALTSDSADANQTVGRKSKDFLKTCHDVIEADVDNILWVKQMMSAAGLSWPYLGTQDDAVHSMVHMAVRYAWPSFLDFTLSTESNVILVKPSRYRAAHLRRLRKDLDKAAPGETYKEYYSMILKHYENRSRGSVVDLSAMIRLEEPFTKFMTGKDWPEDNLTAYEGLDGRKWQRVLTKLAATFSTTRGVQVQTMYASYLDELLELSFRNESQVVLVLGWHAVQYMAPFTNSDLAVNHYTGHRDTAIPVHYSYCLYLTNEITGIGTVADFVRGNFTETVEADVGQLATAVRAVLLGNDSLAYPYKNLGTVYKYFEQARSPELDKVFRQVPSMSVNFAENLVRTTVALRTSYETVVRGVPSWAYFRDPFYTYDGRDFSLLPHVIMFPMYLEGAPEAVRYGILGTEIASGAAQAYFDIVPSKHIRSLLRCMQQATKAHTRWDVPRQALVSLASIDAAFKAFVDSGLDAPAKLAAAPEMTGRQLFYVSFCYSMCATYRPSDYGRCNDVLRNTSNFADTFSCPEGSFMRPANQCTIAF